MSECTPGPWAFRARRPRDVTLKRDHWDVGQPGGNGVAIVFGDDEANARLIAAAPDMLAALKAWAASNWDSLILVPPEPGSVYADMLAAIAKAEGRAS